jgi:hypothetical protein
MSIPCTNEKAEQKRRVRFASGRPQVMAKILRRSDMSEDELERRYWMPSEFVTIKTKAKLATREVMKRNKSGIDLIESVYVKTVKLANSLDDEQLEKWMKNPSDLARVLQPWQARDVGRGLEKYVSRVHREERVDDVEECRHVVLTLLQEPHADPDEIASIYRKHARSAAFYARIVGEADAQAAFIGGDDLFPILSHSSVPTSRNPQPSNVAVFADCPKVTTRRPALVRQIGQCLENRILP